MTMINDIKKSAGCHFHSSAESAFGGKRRFFGSSRLSKVTSGSILLKGEEAFHVGYTE